MKLPGWIKSAVEFVLRPARAPQVGPPPHAPHEIDSSALPQDAGSDDSDNRPESRIAAATESRVNVESDSSPNQGEIDRRRGIVRAFFNDYWSSVDDKPTSFAERLDRAEGYINERVAAGGEAWQLGPATRKQLGLPPSKKA